MQKNSSKEFALKKEFIDLQIELKKFIEETSVFTLNDILKDPLVIHSIDDYINAYKELYDIKQINRTIKKLLKLKKKNVDLTDSLKNVIPSIEPVEFIGKHEYSNNFCFKDSLFTLKSPKILSKDNYVLYKEKMLNIFKNSCKRIDGIKRVTIQKPLVARNFTVSSSHSQLLKKIEKTTETQTKSTLKIGSEITSTASFRNGILKNTNISDKNPKVSSSPVQSPGSVHSNTVKASKLSNQGSLSSKLQDNYASSNLDDQSKEDNSDN